MGTPVTCGRYIKPKLGHLVLTKLQPTHIQELLGEMSARGLSTRTVGQCRTVLRNALGRAVQWGLIARNPADATSPPRSKAKEMNTLAPEEVERLLAVAQESPYYPAIFTALWTGMRRSELLGLRWRDLDLVLGSISVSQVTHRLPGARTVYEDPKSRMGKRYISMPPSLTLTLSRHRERQAALRESVGLGLELDDLVFTWPDGRPMLPNSLTHAFSKMAAKASLADAHLHSLRHTHASLMLREGVSPKVVQERLGHANIGITMDTYSHVMPGLQEAAAEKFEKALAMTIPTEAEVVNSAALPLTTVDNCFKQAKTRGSWMARSLLFMGWRGGTPARTRTGAHGLGNRCSILLSYRGTQSTMRRRDTGLWRDGPSSLPKPSLRL